jgi:lipoyl(octanoyl) transferase
MGKRPTEHNILTDVETLASLGATVHKARRGGDVTFHGPGQHVVYPVVDLRASELGARAYVEGLEDVMIDAAASFGVRATGRVPEMTGVWARGKKLGAVGVQISRGVASHGFAFNRDVDLRWFDAIVPCGLRGKGVTTLRDEVEGGREGGAPSAMEVEWRLIDAFAKRFGYVDVDATRVGAGDDDG